MRNILTLLVILTILGLSSCKKDKEPVGCTAAWATEIQDEISALSAAASAYGTEQTTETCNAYKDAYLDYIDALEPFVECSALTAADRELIQEYIDDSEEQMNALTCE